MIAERERIRGKDSESSDSSSDEEEEEEKPAKSTTFGDLVEVPQFIEIPTQQYTPNKRHNSKRYLAAVKIQKVYRGFRERKKFKQMKVKAVSTTQATTTVTNTATKMRATAQAFQPRFVAKMCFICGLSTDSPQHNVLALFKGSLTFKRQRFIVPM